MKEQFYEWAICSYFATNYLKRGFHSNCLSQEDLHSFGHFIEDLLQYLFQWVELKINGNWIYEFVLSNDPHDPHDPQSPFANLMSHLKFKDTELIIIEIAIKLIIFQMEKNFNIVDMIRDLYFRFRLLVSLDQDDIGSPALMRRILRLFCENMRKFPNLFGSRVDLLQSPLGEIAAVAEFENILRKFQEQDQGIKKVMSKISPTVLPSQSFNKNIKQSLQMRKQDKQDHKKPQKQHNKPLHKQQQQHKKSNLLLKNRPIKKTTSFQRFSSMNRTFKKQKRVEFPNAGSQSSKEQRIMSNKKKDQNILKIEMKIENKNKWGIQPEEMLCDKSF